jgi:hypothetical protein
MTARARVESSVESTIVDQVTIDETGELHLPSDLLALLRPDGERLTLVDVEAKDGALVLRRSSIPEEDWWAYTPEHSAQLQRALSETDTVKMSLDELERMIEDHDK